MRSRFCANNAQIGNAGWRGWQPSVDRARARDGAVRNAERRAGEALRTMTVEEGLSVREDSASIGLLSPVDVGEPAERQRAA